MKPGGMILTISLLAAPAPDLLDPCRSSDGVEPPLALWLPTVWLGK